jgi:release factor glutamine methyltransferase
VARANAQRLRIGNVEFIRADWYLGVAPGPFDAIVSNPPYVAANDAHLDQGDLRFEPRIALSPRLDALAALASIVRGARERLVGDGALVVEHGHDQAEAVVRLFVAGGFVETQSLRDLAGIPRVVAGRAGAAASG